MPGQLWSIYVVHRTEALSGFCPLAMNLDILVMWFFVVTITKRRLYFLYQQPGQRRARSSGTDRRMDYPVEVLPSIPHSMSIRQATSNSAVIMSALLQDVSARDLPSYYNNN